MAKAKRNPEEQWTENYGCDGRPPITKAARGLLDPDGRRNVTRRNTNHCTLCRLHHLGHLKDRASDLDLRLSDLRHAAGEKLQEDVALSGQNSMPSTLNALMGGGGRGTAGTSEIAQMKIDADGRKAKALKAIGGSGRFLLEKIVIDDLTLRETAQLMGVKDNAVLPALRVALDALAQHYGITSTAKARIRGGAAQTIHPYQQFD
jgi:hypothetical protein